MQVPRQLRSNYRFTAYSNLAVTKAPCECKHRSIRSTLGNDENARQSKLRSQFNYTILLVTTQIQKGRGQKSTVAGSAKNIGTESTACYNRQNQTVARPEGPQELRRPAQMPIGGNRDAMHLWYLGKLSSGMLVG